MLAISLSPNTQADDVWHALQILFTPWTWFDYRRVRRLEERLEQFLGGSRKAVAVASGRTGEYAILKSLGIGKGDEVAVQAFNCVAVPNSVLWTGAKPIYIDVNETFNMDPQDLVKKLTPKTKAIIVQHTFGLPAPITAIVEIARVRGIVVIEDCAHSVGLTINGRKAGTFGDYAFFSFGRDKILSGVSGGMVGGKNLTEVRNIIEKLPKPSIIWQLQQLAHPLLFNLVILPTYNLGFGKLTLGKLILVLCQNLGLLTLPVTAQEKNGEKDYSVIKQLGPIPASLATHQFNKLAKLNEHRQKLAQIYSTKLSSRYTKPSPKVQGIWLRYPVLTKHANEIRDDFKRKGILLGGWYKNVLEPAKNLAKLGYVSGSCPMAEKYSAETLNLPTNIKVSVSQAIKLAKNLNDLQL